MSSNKFKIVSSLVVLVVFIWSAINPHDYGTWFLEVAPVLMGAIVMAFTWKRFPLSNFMFGCIAIHALVLIVGGHYTYAEVPIGNWLRDIGVFGRNNYDKVGHLVQGFFPFIYAREILIRNAIVTNRGWLAFICVSIVGLITALYEIIEWLVAVVLGDRATDFLGTQGYIYDTQSDMFLAIAGALIALLLLSRFHNRSMEKISVS